MVGSAFKFALDAAERFRGSLLDWAHHYPGVGWLAPVLLAAGAAFVAVWLVQRSAPEASCSGVHRVQAIMRGDAGALDPAVLPVEFVGGVLALGAGQACPTFANPAAICPFGSDRPQPDGRPHISICRDAAVDEATGDPATTPALRLKDSGRTA